MDLKKVWPSFGDEEALRGVLRAQMFCARRAGEDALRHAGRKWMAPKKMLLHC
jgi:hypothetical protein